MNTKINKEKIKEMDDLELIEFIHDITSEFKNNPPDMNSIPSIFKSYHSSKIFLPRNIPLPTQPLHKAITSRQSCRQFAGEMTLEELSTLLFISAGFRGLSETELGILRSSNYPSAGSRHPLEIYAIIQRVEGIDDSIYHYDPQSHALETLPNRKNISEIFKRSIGDENLANANLLFIISAVTLRSAFKYGPRSYRFFHIEAGHLGQNLSLVSESLGLGSCCIGNWNEKFIREQLKLETKKEILIYLIAIGKKQRSDLLASPNH